MMRAPLLRLGLTSVLVGVPWVSSAQDLATDQRSIVVDTLIQTAEMKGDQRRQFLSDQAAAATDPAVAAALVRARVAATDQATLDDVVRAALTSSGAAGSATVVAPPAPAPAAVPEPPLALPIEPLPGPAPGPPLAIPGHAFRPPPDLGAVRAYQAQALRLDAETELHGGGASYIGGFGGWRGRWHYGVVVPNPIYTTRTWAVYQGAERLEVPEFYRTIGDAGRAAELDRTVARSRGAATALYVLAGAGLGASIAGWYGSRYAPSPALRHQWALTGLAGTGVGLVAFVGGSIPSTRARHSRYDFPYVVDHDAAQREVDAYNDRVRQELGLGVQDVLQAEGAR